MDHDGEMSNEKSDSNCNLANMAFVEDSSGVSATSDIFDEPKDSPKAQTPTGNNSNIKDAVLSLSKVNVRPRGKSNKYQMPHSTEPSSPSKSNVSNIINDQDNSDLNTEANQMKALNVTAEEK